MNQNERKFSVRLDESKTHVLLDSVDGWEKTIRIPSAMWPVEGRDPVILTAENTEPCQDERIRRIFDGLPFRLGRCYENADLLARTLISNEGIQAKVYCGWLLFSDQMPTHHAVVVVNGNQVLDPSTMDYSSLPPFTEGTSREETRAAFIEWMKEQEKKPRSSVKTFGQVAQGHIYLVAELAPKKAVALRRKLERAYPKHPALSCRDGGYTDLQQSLVDSGVR